MASSFHIHVPKARPKFRIKRALTFLGCGIFAIVLYVWVSNFFQRPAEDSKALGPVQELGRESVPPKQGVESSSPRRLTGYGSMAEQSNATVKNKQVHSKSEAGIDPKSYGWTPQTILEGNDVPVSNGEVSALGIKRESTSRRGRKRPVPAIVSDDFVWSGRWDTGTPLMVAGAKVGGQGRPIASQWMPPNSDIYGGRLTGNEDPEAQGQQEEKVEKDPLDSPYSYRVLRPEFGYGIDTSVYDSVPLEDLIKGPPDGNPAEEFPNGLLSLGYEGAVELKVEGGYVVNKKGSDFFVHSIPFEGSAPKKADVFVSGDGGPWVSLGRIVTGNPARAGIDLAIAGVERADRILILDALRLSSEEKQVYSQFNGQAGIGFDVDSVELIHTEKQKRSNEVKSNA